MWQVARPRNESFAWSHWYGDALLAKQSRDESLAFRHAFDLDRDGFHRLLHALQPLRRFAIRRHGSRQ